MKSGPVRTICHVQVLFALALSVGSCGQDEADREYIAALRGDEDGSTWEERIAHLSRAIEMEPERARYLEARAVLRIDRRDFGSALADVDQAIELADRPYLRFLRGLVLCQNGDCGAAIPDFDRAIAEQPDNAQFYRGRALALVASGRPADALTDGERLVGLSPQVGTSYYARGLALAALGRHEEAIQCFDEALGKMPELVYPLVARADAYDALGDAAMAVADHAAADLKARDRSGCAYCLDPFRY